MPGIGLLCLPIGAGIPLLLYGSAALPAVTVDLGAAIAGILLLAGLWSPVAGALVAIAELWIAFSHRGDVWAHFLLAALGAGLAMLGPGAWSVDSHLFGRKLFEIRNGKRTPLK